MDDSKTKVRSFAVGLVMFLAATTAYALDCDDTNRERVTYEVAQVRIDGVVTETSEFADMATAHGDFEDGVTLEVITDEWASQLSFGGAQ